MKRGKRRYVLKARGQQVAETRARIVEAIVHLHQEVGPNQTTVSAIAERAGVERLTVYRHFTNETEMLAACSHRYFELNPPPDPSAWATETNPDQRARRGLQDLYGFFGRTAPMFAKIYRDVPVNQSVEKVMSHFDGHLRNIADTLAGGGAQASSANRRQTILRHAVKFATWQSFEADGLDNGRKVDLLLAWLAG